MHDLKHEMGAIGTLIRSTVISFLAHPISGACRDCYHKSNFASEAGRLLQGRVSGIVSSISGYSWREEDVVLLEKCNFHP
jgi:hypothetical protein